MKVSKEKTDGYTSWKKMRDRCKNTRSHAYHDYGGRGIRICERWSSFEVFLSDMGPRPSKKHSLDRVDVNGDYEPGNCRWATTQQQGDNKRNTRRVTHNGLTMTLREWSGRTSLPFNTLKKRMESGASPDKLLDRFSKRGVSKLSPALVQQAVSLLKAGESAAKTGRAVGVCPNMILSIRNGGSWREVVSEQDVAEMLAVSKRRRRRCIDPKGAST